MNETNVRTALFNWLTQSLGLQHIQTVSFNADFVSGNTIAGTFSGTPVSVPFRTDQATTLSDLATAVRKIVGLNCIPTAARQITVTAQAVGVTIAISGVTVTGGASQATATVLTTQAAATVTVYRSDQTLPKATPYPFATYRLDSIVQIGHEYTDGPDDNGIVTVKAQRQATVTAHYFGPDPFAGLMRAHLALDTTATREVFFNAGISILQKGTVQNISSMLETKWEDHAVFEFYIGLSDSVTEDLGFIEKAGVEVEIKGSKDFTIGPFDIPSS